MVSDIASVLQLYSIDVQDELTRCIRNKVRPEVPQHNNYMWAPSIHLYI